MLGDSLINHLEDMANIRRVPSLGLLNKRVLWLGSSGMHWPELVPKFQLTMILNPQPMMIVIHLGGNDLATVTQGKMIKKIKKDINYIASVFPSTQVVWSDILPRLVWRGVDNTPENLRKLDLKRKRINRAGRQATRQVMHGKAIIHEIDTTPGLHKPDGVHLTPIGNSIFLHTMQEALSMFFNNPNQRVYNAN